MANGLHAADRYNELYSTYLSEMQQPKYCGNPDEASAEELLRDLYKVVCGNGTKRKSIMHVSVDNRARLTIASEDMDSIQTQLLAQEVTCQEFRDGHGKSSGKVVKAAGEAPAAPATVVNVTTAPAATERKSGWLITVAQTAKNLKDVIQLTVMLTTAIIIIMGYLTRPTPVVAGITPEQTQELIKEAVAKQLAVNPKAARP